MTTIGFVYFIFALWFSGLTLSFLTPSSFLDHGVAKRWHQSLRRTPWECNGQLCGPGNVVRHEPRRTPGWQSQTKSAAILAAQPIPRRPSTRSDDAEDLWFPQYCCKKLLSTWASEGWAYFSGEDQGKSGMAASQSWEKALSKDEKSEISCFWRVSYIGARGQTGVSQHSSTDELAGAKSEPKKAWKSPPAVT